MAYETIKSELAYKGLVIDVTRDTIVLPDGREAVREIVRHGGAAAAIPVDKDGKLVFVRQYRHPVGALVLELPAGTLERGENPRDCAARELEEETGMKAEKLTFLFKLYVSVGICTEVIHIYLAEELSEGRQNLDEEEFLTVERYTPEEAAALVKNGGIVDGKTISAVMFYWKEYVSHGERTSAG